MSLGNIQNIVKQLLHGLNFLKLNGVIHCDLKPENIMFSTKGRLKLIDFGSAIMINDINYFDLQTLPYKAPEMIMRA